MPQYYTSAASESSQKYQAEKRVLRCIRVFTSTFAQNPVNAYVTNAGQRAWNYATNDVTWGSLGTIFTGPYQYQTGVGRLGQNFHALGQSLSYNIMFGTAEFIANNADLMRFLSGGHITLRTNETLWAELGYLLIDSSELSVVGIILDTALDISSDTSSSSSSSDSPPPLLPFFGWQADLVHSGCNSNQ